MAILRAKFKKTGEMKYISHLDLVRLFHRVLRRGGINISYTQGFNPHPIISFATALSLGIESEGEYFDVKLNEEISFPEFKLRVNEHMPQGIEIVEGKYIDEKEDSLMSIVEYSDYEVTLVFSGDEIDESILQKWNKSFLEQEEILITRKKKKKRRQRHQEFKEVDVKPLIKKFTLKRTEGNKAVYDTLLTTGSKGNLKPEDLILLFGEHLEKLKSGDEMKKSLEITSMEILRLNLYHEVNGELKNLIDAVS